MSIKVAIVECNHLVHAAAFVGANLSDFLATKVRGLGDDGGGCGEYTSLIIEFFFYFSPDLYARKVAEPRRLRDVFLFIIPLVPDTMDDIVHTCMVLQ